MEIWHSCLVRPKQPLVENVLDERCDDCIHSDKPQIWSEHRNTVKLILLSWFNEKLFGESGCTLIVWDVYKTYIQRSGHSNILICYLLKNIAI